MIRTECVPHDRATVIVCSCNVISRREIEAVIEDILADDPFAVLTPGLLYHRLGRRGRCCGCFPVVSRILVEHLTIVRQRVGNGEWAGAGENEAERLPPAA